MFCRKTAALLAALALTACASTNAPSVIETVEVPVMPPVPAALMDTPVRPAPPAAGTPAALLEHAARFGAYVQKLETLNQGWRDWAAGRLKGGNP